MRIITIIPLLVWIIAVFLLLIWGAFGLWGLVIAVIFLAAIQFG